MTAYNLYLIVSLGAPRNHHALYFEPSSPSSPTPAILIQVTGNIQTGMTLDIKNPAPRPEDALDFIERTLLGSIPLGEYHPAETLCRSVPVPRKQFDGPKRLYPEEPLRRCQEWTTETVELLQSQGILHTHN